MPDEQKYTLRQTGSVIQQLLDSIQSQSSDISAKADRNYVDSALATKVDKETGKGLSSNDYTTADRQKLAGIAANAQANVPSDWNATTGDARILNKPDLSSFVSSSDLQTGLAGKVDKETGKGLSSNDFTTAEKTKLAGIGEGAEANVIDTIMVNGVAQAVINKAVNLSVTADVETITTSEIDALFN